MSARRAESLANPKPVTYASDRDRHLSPTP